MARTALALLLASRAAALVPTLRSTTVSKTISRVSYLSEVEDADKKKKWWDQVRDSASFLKFSELQVRVDGVGATSRHRDAVDVAVREFTRLVNVQTLSFDTGRRRPRGVEPAGPHGYWGGRFQLWPHKL